VLGLQRTFMIAPRSDAGAVHFKLPSDLAGLNVLSYSPSDGPEDSPSLEQCCRQIAQVLHKREAEMTWITFGSAVTDLKERVWAGETMGGFTPDFIIGVNPGGAIVGGILHYMLHRQIPFYNVSIRKHRLEDPRILVQRISERFPSETEPNILIVDASMKKGDSMRAVLSLVEERYGQRAQIRTAVVVDRKELRPDDPFEADYFIDESYLRFPYGHV
jgi:hypoxanthine phosphoribosyltransferase